MVMNAKGSLSKGIVSTFSEIMQRRRRKGHLSEQHFWLKKKSFNKMDNIREEISVNLKMLCVCKREKRPFC